MKFLLLFIALFCISYSSYSQMFGRNYSTGTYYTADGVKHTGLISVDFSHQPGMFSVDPDNFFYFKTDKNAKKEKIKASAIQSFTIINPTGVDTFVVAHNNSDLTEFINDFMQVVLDNNQIKLYCYHSERKGYTSMGGMFGNVSSTDFFYYFYGANADDAVEIDDRNYKDATAKLLTDPSPEIIAITQNPKYKLKKFPEAVGAYKTYKNLK